MLTLKALLFGCAIGLGCLACVLAATAKSRRQDVLALGAVAAALGLAFLAGALP